MLHRTVVEEIKIWRYVYDEKGKRLDGYPLAAYYESAECTIKCEITCNSLFLCKKNNDKVAPPLGNRL